MEKQGKISKSNLSLRIVFYELVGFAVFIIILWMNEIYDLPYKLFGAAPTPINFHESCFESIIAGALCLLTVCSTQRLLKRIKYLQGIIPICSFCKKVRVGDDWISVDQYVREHSSADFSHGLCPECLKKYYEAETGASASTHK